MKKQEIINYLDEYSLSPNKKLGQNFLINESLSKNIADLIDNNSKNIMEIGPGFGSLTDFIVLKSLKLRLIEIDSGLYEFLKNKYEDNDKVTVIHENFLKYFSGNKPDIIIGNLPYYCSSDIIFHIIDNFLPEKIIAMLQKELCQRIKAEAGDADYGALSASIKLYYDTQIEFNVDKHSFFPVPDVTSSIITFKRNKTVLTSEIRKIVHSLIKSAFWGKRKTIIKSLSNSPFSNFDKEILAKSLNNCELDMKLRAENISTEKYIQLAKEIYKIKK